MRRVALLIISFVLAPACASSQYQPKARRFVSGAVNAGVPKLRRCDQTQVLGPFFSGVPELFPADSAAQAPALQAKRNQTTAGILSIGGSVLSGVGTAFVAVDLADDDGPGTNDIETLGAVGFGLAIGGLITSIAGASKTTQARARLLDAVNVYNDEVADLTDAEVCPSPSP